MRRTGNESIAFIGIGAQKAGTSWLFQQLCSIPEFSLPHLKELHYFDRHPSYPSPNVLSRTYLYQRIFDYKFVWNAVKDIWAHVTGGKINRATFLIKWYFSNYNDRWYLSLFNGFKGFKGEITPSYSILEKADIRNMYSLCPDVKIILLLRSPIERAWSHFRFMIMRTKENFANWDNSRIIDFLESPVQSLRSDYIRTIGNYSSIFPKDQILIGFYDAISDDPEALMRDMLRHICGDRPISINHLDLERVVFKSPEKACPQQVKEYLKNRYHDQMKELSDTYGGYFSKWYEESFGGKPGTERSNLAPTMYLNA